MVVRNTKTLTRAKMMARKARKIGLVATINKKKMGYGVSTTRKKK